MNTTYRWVKASERLPKENALYFVRNMKKGTNKITQFHDGEFRRDFDPHTMDWEWLEEIELPYIDTVDINLSQEEWRELIETHIGKMWGGLEMASIDYFKETGTINGSFSLRLVALMLAYGRKLELKSLSPTEETKPVVSAEDWDSIWNACKGDYEKLKAWHIASKTTRLDIPADGILKKHIEKYNNGVTDFFKFALRDNEVKVFVSAMEVYANQKNTQQLSDALLHLQKMIALVESFHSGWFDGVDAKDIEEARTYLQSLISK